MHISWRLSHLSVLPTDKKSFKVLAPLIGSDFFTNFESVSHAYFIIYSSEIARELFFFAPIC